MEYEFRVKFGVINEISSSDVPIYTGAYSAQPDFEKQTLNTKDKRMTNDVTVEAIEVQRVSNTAGGRTVYIGGTING